MRVAVASILAGTVAAFACAGPVRADGGPVIVVPGKPGVPVMINGVDASGAIVTGDWGLKRPGHGYITIEGPVVFMGPETTPGYYPATGRAPAYGRYEIDTPPRFRGSTSFQRSWSAESNFEAPAAQYPPYEPPQVSIEQRPRRPYRPLPPFPPGPPPRH